MSKNLFRSIFLIISTILIVCLYNSVFSQVSDTDKSIETLILNLNQSVQLSSCEDNEEWTLKSLNPIHSPNSFLPEDVKDLSPSLGLSNCGYKKAQCITKQETHPFLEKEVNTHTWYVNSYPTVYSKGKIGEQFRNNKNIHKNILSGLSRNVLEFIPIDNAIDSESNIIAIEKLISQSVDNTEYQFFDVKADSEIDEGKALCKVIGREWGKALPDQCIITRFKNTNGHYVLGLVESKPFDSLCPVFARFNFLSRLSLREAISDEFKSNFRNSLIKSSLQIEPNKIDLKGNIKTGITISADAGPQISQIDDRLREQIYIALQFIPSDENDEVRFQITPDGNIESIPQDNTLNNQLLNVNGRLAAWVSRQNTDPSGNWRMPKQGYYKKLESIVIEAVNDAFQETCKNEDKNSVTIEALFGSIKECR